MEQEIKISPVAQEDLLAVFNLSNLSSVRAVSFDSEKIKLSSHEKWFAAKLADPNTVMLKATLGEDFTGQVRLSIEDDNAVIGVSVDEKYRGKGIASKLLQAAILEARERNVKVIDAFIKTDNLASIGLFKKNGFVYSNDEKVKGILAKKYIYIVE